MANLIIGGRNLIRRSATTLTPGSEVAGFDADNLKIDHPSEFWRTGGVATSYLQIDLGATQAYDLVAPLYGSVTPIRNLLKHSGDITGNPSDWVEVGCAASLNSSTRPPGEGVVAETISASGSGEHYVQASVDLEAYTSSGLASISVGNTTMVIQAAVAEESDGRAALEVKGAAGSDVARVDIDTTDGSIQATSDGGALTAGTAVTKSLGVADGVEWHLISLPFTATPTQTTFSVNLRVLDNSYTDSYAAGTETAHFAAPMLSLQSTAALAYELSTTATSCRWKVLTDSASISPGGGGANHNSGWLSFPRSESSGRWDEEVGFLHSWHRIPATDQDGSRYLLLELHDPDNVDSRIDLSNLFVGKSFQPTKNFKPATLTRRWDEETDPNAHYAARGKRFRTWSLELHYLSSAEAEGELNDILMHVGRSRGALVIVDPDETTYGQTRTIYGRITGSDISHVGYNTTLGGQQWRVALQIREIVP